MTIRVETPRDRAAIEAVHLAAFAGHPYSRQTEHRIVNALRDDGALTVSLVAADGPAIVGHIAFSPAKIAGHDGPLFLLGPLGVLPSHQRRGIGHALVREGLEAIKALGAQACVLVGEPSYYSRFGFTHSPGLSFEGVVPQFCLALPFHGQSPQGQVSPHPAFSLAP